ncbi:hypothetical protein C8J57DRAFT_1244133 [Mycena rebaudengoi]|nr:hypothetical protein C8J57DRAFT_1244133 [Mycena rebaudengoi]
MDGWSRGLTVQFTWLQPSANSLMFSATALLVDLQIGQTLCLTTTSGPTSTITSSGPTSSGGSRCTRTYTVVSGDTCSAIESSTGVSDAQLHALNPAINSGCTNLQIGQTLCLTTTSSPTSTITSSGPTSSGGGGCTRTYTVVSGDTCLAVESKTGVSDAQLHALNPGINSGCANDFLQPRPEPWPGWPEYSQAWPIPLIRECAATFRPDPDREVPKGCFKAVFRLFSGLEPLNKQKWSVWSLNDRFLSY